MKHQKYKTYYSNINEKSEYSAIKNIKFSVSIITQKYGYHVISHFKK